MKRIIRYFLWAFFLLQAFRPGGQVFGQDDVLQHWDRFRKTNLEEKVFVHTDKDYYLAGELCWFKCYDVSATDLRPMSLSKVAYVEVLGRDNKPVLQAKIALDSGSGSGSLYLPFTLASGAYTLRAYTSWMKNAPAEFFFHKTLTILNTRESYTEIATPGQDRITFFPEGGNMVEGLPCNVAFQGTDLFGDPIDFKGVLLDDQGDTLLRFSPISQGMGHFILTPAAGHTYKAVFRQGDGPSFTQALPKAFPTGTVMQLDTATEGMLKVVVHSNQTGEGILYLLIHSGNTMKVVQTQSLSSGTATFMVDKNRLGPGISNLTVFNGQRQPLCERLYFVYPTSSHLVAMAPGKSTYDSRESVHLHLDIPGTADPDLSMAVYRVDSLQHVDETNIYAYLWLGSDLPGPVIHPEAYFDRMDTGTAASMDNLMLTQGWRRFRWEDILKDKPPSFTYLPEYDGHLVTGRMVDIRTGLPASDVEGFLSVPGKRTLFNTTISDSNGRVAFDVRHMYGSSEIIVQTNTASRDTAFRLEIADPFSEIYPAYPPGLFRLPLQYPATVSEEVLSMQVQNAYRAMKIQSPVFPDIDTNAFYGHPDLTYRLDDYTRFTTMEEVLREYVQLVNVARRGEHFHLWVYDAPEAEPFDDDPLILLDGVPMFNTDQFMKYDPFKIRKVDVVTRRYFLGGTAVSGIVNWVTYRGDLSGYELDPHATALDYEGLQEKREFYSPVYASDAQKASRLPDYRNVLYWNPRLHTAANGSGDVQFYTSDLPGKYVIVVEGISRDGHPIYGQTTLQVGTGGTK